MLKDQKTYCLLVVEDNTGDFVLIQDYLEESILHSEIIRAKTLKEAKGYCEKDIPFDLILLDLSLPDKVGEELVKEMVFVGRNRPVVVLTGYTDMKFAVRSLSLGVSDYLLKDELSPQVLYKSIVYNIERNKNYIRLKESEQRYSELFQLSPQPMWVYDRDSFAFLDVNQAAIDHYGYTHDEFMAMTILDIRPDHLVDEVKSLVEERRKVSGGFFRGLFKHKKKNGTVIDVEVRSNSINYKGAKANVILANDITERLKHVNIIEEQNLRLREIAWTQSHVVRAPLSRLMGLVSLVQSNIINEQERTQLLQYIEQSAEEMDEIIREIVKKTEGMNVKPTKKK
ncbi:PAS domain S-box protein [Pleomorphovibrio marinus]|uniref:PAS domain S-box protein n=1 Tax=Pleomorphovibrio marinus TaxID=2164132 RepID=UPI000E0B1297|nr:PAS domain S-box protein [Pleomorphovibrio marinus]